MPIVTPEHVRAYREVGAVRVEQAFDATFIARMTALLDDAVARLRAKSFPRRAAPDPVFRDIEFEDHDGYIRLVNLMPQVPALRELVLASQAPAIVAALTGATHLSVWLDATFSKEGSHGQTATPWHNDECTFSLQGEHLPSFWMALTDVDEDNSPLQTLAGSHRDAWRYHSTFFPTTAPRPPEYRPWNELLERVGAPGADIRTWTAKAGDILLIHPKTIHGAPPRRSTQPGRRLAFTLRWIGSDVVWRPNALTMGLSPFDKDPRMQHDQPPPRDMFPWVWQAA